MNRSESIKELAAALAKARKSFGPITRSKTVKVKTRTGGEYTFAYAPLEEILGAVVPALADNGLSLLQTVENDAMITCLVHDSGEFVENAVPLVLPVESERTSQTVASSMTYSSRQGVTRLLVLAPDEDEDGNLASGNEAKVVAQRSFPPKKPGKPEWAKPEHEAKHACFRLLTEAVKLGLMDDSLLDGSDFSKARVRREMAGFAGLKEWPPEAEETSIHWAAAADGFEKWLEKNRPVPAW